MALSLPDPGDRRCSAAFKKKACQIRPEWRPAPRIGGGVFQHSSGVMLKIVDIVMVGVESDCIDNLKREKIYEGDVRLGSMVSETGRQDQ